MEDPIKRYPAGSQEQFDKFMKEVRGGTPAENELTHQVMTDWSQWLNFNYAFDKIENVAEKFDRAVDANRKTLKLAAISFVVAAAISFAQGLGAL